LDPSFWKHPLEPENGDVEGREEAPPGTLKSHVGPGFLMGSEERWLRPPVPGVTASVSTAAPLDCALGFPWQEERPALPMPGLGEGRHVRLESGSHGH
ncbi:hypothetical protein E2320_014116, partial [Naja naja]